MKLSLIVAAAENRCIGVNNKLPWYLPEDLKYFKRVTMGKPVIMGRKTWESIGKPLPGRTNIVITSNKNYQAEGAEIVNSMSEAIELAECKAGKDSVDELMVIGGEGIYCLCLSQCDRLYYTRVHAEVQGDAFFPELDWDEWELINTESYEASNDNPYAYSFCVYDRRVS